MRPGVLGGHPPSGWRRRGTGSSRRVQFSAPPAVREGPYRTDVALQLDRLPRVLPEHSVFVAFYEVPMVRYLYEYGPFVARPEYPGAFRFETPAEWRAKVPIAADAEGIAFIVSALPIAEARARFPGFTLLPRPGPDRSRSRAGAQPGQAMGRRSPGLQRSDVPVSTGRKQFRRLTGVRGVTSKRVPALARQAEGRPPYHWRSAAPGTSRGRRRLLCPLRARPA
jgi:hypothetical protein